MYKGKTEGKFLKIRPATWQSLTQLRPEGLSWDKFFASMIPAIRVEAQRLARERVNLLENSSTTGDKE